MMNTDTRALFPAMVFPLVLLILLQSGTCGTSGRRQTTTGNANATNAGAARSNANANRQAEAGRTQAEADNTPTPSQRGAGASNMSQPAANRNGAAVANSREEQRTMRNGESVAVGTWGGAGISLDINERGASVEFDCAHGAIEQRLALDATGAFSASGTFTPERGGPARVDEQPARHPARYSGRVEGERMTLRITLTDSNTEVGSFTLTRGAEPRLHKCL